MDTVRSTTLHTPDGPFSIVFPDADAGARAHGVADTYKGEGTAAAEGDTEVVLASGWTDDIGFLLQLIHPSLRPDTGEVLWENPACWNHGSSFAAEAVLAYYEGDPDAPSRVPVLQRSGEFREAAWRVLRTVKPGEPITYAEFAALAGNPRAARAAATACSHNAAALFVPCHRIISSDGSLGGFRYGLDLKRKLLDREAALTHQGHARPVGSGADPNTFD